jgi:hypothetical protein
MAFSCRHPGLLVSRLEEEWVDDEDRVDMLGALAGLYQGGVVMQTQALQGSKMKTQVSWFWLAC